MNKWMILTATFLAVSGTGLARAQKQVATPHQPSPIFASTGQSVFPTVSMMRVTPDTIPFTANNPGGVIEGGSQATVTWTIAGGKSGQTWTLRVGANSPSIIGCTTIPVSAITLRCVSASVNGGGQTSAGCTIPNFTALPSTLPGLPVASGNEGNANAHYYTAVLSYQLTDSWRYIANTCPLNVSYSLDVQ